MPLYNGMEKVGSKFCNFYSEKHKNLIMCGITGIINLNGKPVTLNELKNMTNAISHRGLDYEGSWIEKNVGIIVIQGYQL